MLLDWFSEKRGIQPDIGELPQLEAEDIWQGVSDDGLAQATQENVSGKLVCSPSGDGLPPVTHARGSEQSSLSKSCGSSGAFSNRDSSLTGGSTPGGSWVFRKNSAVLAERLKLAKKEARLRQLRMRAPVVVVGSVAFLVGCVGYFDVPWWASLVAKLISCLGILVCLSALQPSDNCALPLSGIFILLPCLLLYFTIDFVTILDLRLQLRESNCIVKYAERYIVPCWIIHLHIITRLWACTVLAVGMIRTIRALRIKNSPRRMLAKYWSIVGVTLICVAVAWIITHAISLLAGLVALPLRSLLADVPTCIVGILMRVKTDFRSKLKSMFMSRSESAITAAGIAELLGGQNIDDLLVTARSTFKFVRADRIVFQDMEHNRPNPDLGLLTETGRLGFVDAFVSHSWHDDAEVKWIALQEFREEFRNSKSREPKLWIDKYSIDQNNIDVSLASLPVYMSGCRELWILCGSTYLERLWCIIEIYVFIEMGGLQSNLHVKLLKDVNKNLLGSTFNARNAKCFTESDTEKLRVVIETTGYNKIHRLVKNLFFPGVERRSTRSSC